MAFNLFAALAPALACLLLCAFVEGILPFWKRFVHRLYNDELLLELLAELTVHLSTYGSAVIGWLAHIFLHGELGILFPVIVGLPWFYVLLRISLWLRGNLKDLREQEEPEDKHDWRD